MNFPFQIEFEIFDKTERINDKQLSIRDNLVYGDAMKDIIKKVVRLTDDNQFKILDRAEAVISSIDEKKQLRLSIHGCLGFRCHSIYFNQDHSSCQNFTESELLCIVKAMTHCLEEYLGYSISEPKLLSGR